MYTYALLNHKTLNISLPTMCRDGINPLDSTWAQDMVTVKNNAKIQCIFNSLFSVLDIISIQVLILRYKTHKENKFLGNYLEIKSCDICNNSREELNQLHVV